MTSCMLSLILKPSLYFGHLKSSLHEKLVYSLRFVELSKYSHVKACEMSKNQSKGHEHRHTRSQSGYLTIPKATYFSSVFIKISLTMNNRLPDLN